MTATVDQSEAILKRKYPKGKLPDAMYVEAPFLASINKSEDFGGSTYTVALQIERGQASSASAPLAIGQSATTAGNYQRFLLTRSRHFGVAQITGEDLEAAKGDDNALVDMWDNETEQASKGEMQVLEMYLFGDGTGVLGTISSTSTLASTTISLNDIYDGCSAAISKFAVGQQLQAVSNTTLSPVIRSGFVTISTIDRDLGTLTVVGNWNDPSNIPGITVTDSLVRRGDAAVGGANTVIVGTKSYIAGGPTPAPLFGLNRTSDVVRLAGQRYDASSQPMEDALIAMWSKRSQQFRQKGKMVVWANTLDLGSFLKSIGGKVEYTRVNMDSKTASVSFEGIDLMTTQGPIRIMDHPYVNRGDLHMLYMDSFSVKSLGPAPQLLHADGQNFLRTATDDTYQVRFGMYGQFACNNPAGSIIGTGWGQ